MPKFVMSDARVFTDYNPNCELNNTIQNKYKIMNSHQYREFLQKNADKIMSDNSKSAQQPDCKLCPVCKDAIEYKPHQQ
jgi:hypothetical protein